MERDDRSFLEYVSRYCAEYPTVIPQMISTMTESMKVKLESEASKRAEIESALAMALMRRSKSADSILVSKLEKIKEYGMLAYDAVIKELSGVKNEH